MNRMLSGAIRIVLIASVAGGCAADPASRAGSAGAGRSEDARGISTDSVGSDWFVDRAADLGLDFVHFNGASGHFYYPEILPPGVGLLDYDNDGDLDVFLVQGRMLGPDPNVSAALIPPASPGPLTGRLYRNDLEIGPRREPIVALRRRDRAERPARRRLRLRGGDGRHRQRRLGRSARDELRIGTALSQRGRRDVHRRVGPGRHRGAERVRRFGGVRRLRPGRLAGSVHRQQRRLRPRQPHRLPQHGGGARLLSSGDVRGAARPPLSKPG